MEFVKKKSTDWTFRFFLLVVYNRAYASKQWPWQWNERNTAIYKENMKEQREAQERLNELISIRQEIEREGKSAVGLWSSLGLQEMREMFWENFRWGLGLAKGMTWHQIYMSAFRMFLMPRDRDENLLGILFTWILKIAYNVSVGIVISLFSFFFSIPSLIDSYGASFMSSFAFFAIAIVAASSVVLTVLSCMWGGVAGGTYLAIKAAQNHARLQNQRRREFIRNHQRGSGGGRGVGYKTN